MLNEKLIYEKSSVDAGARIIQSLEIERDQRSQDMGKLVKKNARDKNALYEELEQERLEYNRLLEDTGSKRTIFPSADYGRTRGYSPSPPPMRNSAPKGRSPRDYTPEPYEKPTRKSSYDDYDQEPTRKESYSAEPDREVYTSNRKYSYSPEPARDTYKSDRKRKASDSPEPFRSPKRKASYSPDPYKTRGYSPEAYSPKRKASYSPEPYKTRKNSYTPEPDRETYKGTTKGYSPSPKTPKSYSFDRDDYSPLGRRDRDDKKSSSPRGYDLDDADLYAPLESLETAEVKAGGYFGSPPTKEPKVVVDEYAYDYPTFDKVTRGAGYTYASADISDYDDNKSDVDLKSERATKGGDTYDLYDTPGGDDDDYQTRGGQGQQQPRQRW